MAESGLGTGSHSSELRELVLHQHTAPPERPLYREARAAVDFTALPTF